MFVKVCGIQSREAIDWAVELGYSAVGFVLHPSSVRYCDPAKTRELSTYAGNKIATVGVGVSYEEVNAVKNCVDFVQIYEYRETERLIYASDEEPVGLKYDYFLYDSSRGSGGYSPFPEWLEPLSDRLIISGGLNADNAGSVIRHFMPYGIDVSSGVEAAHGEKDYNRMKEFIEEVRHAVC